MNWVSTRVVVVAGALLAAGLAGSPAAVAKGPDATATPATVTWVSTRPTSAATHGTPTRIGLTAPRPGVGTTALDVPPEEVTCSVTGPPPWYRNDNGTHRIRVDVNLTCNGAIRKATISLWLLGSIDGVSYTTEANNLNKSAPGTPFIIGAENQSPVCLPQYHVGMAFIDVVFLAGSPIEESGWFQSGISWIGC